ncbi:hypothetical protein F0U44_08330 [Nocardioides humilatus]|uniref:Uncharacterized protein n=1 Tax=Nocardioides humilatus TaxID=2607660 RepID=A0A5B1LFT5_9ACTN|nr:hypothetical protein [Nocardioides humilatus]KAA1418507.1 hypothetical protein F0U44_08330 [Nocardioides humilatus]
MIYVVFGVAGVVLLLLAIWSGNRMLRNPTGNGAGIADGMGVFVDAFDPGRARADQDLKSKDHEVTVVPSADGDDQAVRIDQAAMRATIRRPKPPQD